MTSTQKPITPFLHYFMHKLDNFPASTTPAESKGFTELQQYICDSLDDLNHYIAIYLEYKRLKSTMPKMEAIEQELKQHIPTIL